jgi:hypothetical protein
VYSPTYFSNFPRHRLAQPKGMPIIDDGKEVVQNQTAQTERLGQHIKKSGPIELTMPSNKTITHAAFIKAAAIIRA